MPKQASDLAGDVLRSAQRLDRYVARMENLYADEKLGQRDLELAYSGAVLTLHTTLERTIEELFFGVLMGRVTTSRAVRTLISIPSERVAHDLIFGRRRYADWLPYDRTMERATLFLSRGLPFSQVAINDRQLLNDLTVLRNVIAHKSRHANNRFHSVFIKDKNLPPGDKSPSGYLRGQHALGQSRLNFLLSRSTGVMARLCR
jgi:hypothetical protein